MLIRQVTLKGVLVAFTGLPISFTLVSLGLTLESPGLIAGAFAAAAISVGSLPKLSGHRSNDARPVRLIGRRILACAGCAAVLYLLSFWIAIWPLMRAPMGDKNWRLFCRVYQPIIRTCPHTVLDSYMMYAGGLSDIEAFFLVEVLREKDEVADFELCN